MCAIKSVASADVLNESGVSDSLAISASDNLPTSPSDANSDQCQCFLRKGLLFLHLNARSLLPKLNDFKILAAKSKVAVIGVIETWLDHSNDDSEAEMPGYIILRHDRNRNGGGAWSYVPNDSAFNPRFDLQKDGVETVWAEVLLPKTHPILIGVCNRPPKQCEFDS